MSLELYGEDNYQGEFLCLSCDDGNSYIYVNSIENVENK